MQALNLIDRVTEASKGAPPTVTEVTVEVLITAKQHGPESLVAAALARLIRALVVAISHNEKGLINVVSAPSDLQALLAFLEEPAVIAELSNLDPLAEAKARGILRKSELFTADGGCVSAEEAGKLTNVSRTAIDKARQRGDVLALPRGQDSWVYPIWQFEGGHYLPGLRQLLEVFADQGPWMQASFLLSENERLNRATPLSLLQRNQIECVLSAAKAFGQHGAT